MCGVKSQLAALGITGSTLEWFATDGGAFTDEKELNHCFNGMERTLGFCQKKEEKITIHLHVNNNKLKPTRFKNDFILFSFKNTHSKQVLE